MMMFMSVLDNSLSSARYGELAGARVMITGLSPTLGVDIARAFADHKARLVLQTPGETADPETTALLAMLAETAHEIKVFDTPVLTDAAATTLAQNGSQVYGSVDALINLITVTPSELSKLSDFDEIEDFITCKLRAALVMTRVAANRMRLSLTEGLILNVVAMPEPTSGGAALIVGMLRTALAAMTKTEAQAWAANGIRINAIGPRAVIPGEKAKAVLASEPEMAAVALYLASKRARGLSGHIFDAEGSLTTCG
jgi:NAD(P)-dependent dehydrogenase (short-subunit alcohol dehydrogenase family)